MTPPPSCDEGLRKEVSRVAARWRAHRTAEAVVLGWIGARRNSPPSAAYDDRSEPSLECPRPGALRFDEPNRDVGGPIASRGIRVDTVQRRG
eukprot:5231395-Alexandrium_andersonii.AAC.1